MDRKTLCVLPWLNLNTTPMGQCKLCCNIQDHKLIKDEATVPYNWGTASVRDIWNSTHMQRTRRTMLDDLCVPDCEICYSIEASGNKSPRNHANAAHPDVFDSPDLTDMASALPTSLELRLSTTCNLRCVTCWSGSSSKIAAERREMIEHGASMPEWLADDWRREVDLNRQGISWYHNNDEDYISSDISLGNFAQIAPRLQRLYITGGEPTMDANIYRYLETLHAAGNLDCHISFTTNGTLWNHKLIQIMRSFRNTEIQISVDGYGKLDEYIRHGTDWAIKSQIIKRYLTEDVAKTFKVFTVVSALNCLDMVSLLRWLADMSDACDTHVVWYPIMLDNPWYLAVESVPLMARHRAVQDIETWQGSFRSTRCTMAEGIGYMNSTLLSRAHSPERMQLLRQWLTFNDGLRDLRHGNISTNLSEALDA